MAAPSQPSPSAPANTDWKKTSFIDRARLRPGDDTDIEVVRKSSKYIRRIVLIRHGQSEGNVNKKMLTTVADHAIPLSEKGMEEMRECAKKLKEYFEKTYGTDPDKYPPIRLWTSPYKRCRQSSQILFDVCAEYFADQKEHILLGEQQFGLFEGVTAAEVAQLYPVESSHFKKLLDHHGRFWARPPLGESRFDVAKRVHQSFSTFQADAKRHSIRDIVVVTHGITFRAFFMMWLQQTPEWFENEPNPGNGCIRVIEDDRDQGVLFAGFDDYAPGAGFTGPAGSVAATSSHHHTHKDDQTSSHSSASNISDPSSNSSTTAVVLDNQSSNSADDADDESEDSASDESQLSLNNTNGVPLATPQENTAYSKTSEPIPVAVAATSSSTLTSEPSSASSLGGGLSDAHVHFALPNSPAGSASSSPVAPAELPVRPLSPTKPTNPTPSPTHPPIQTHPVGHPATRLLNSSDAPVSKFSQTKTSSSSGMAISNHSMQQQQQQRSAMKGGRQTKRHLARTLGSSDGSYAHSHGPHSFHTHSYHHHTHHPLKPTFSDENAQRTQNDDEEDDDSGTAAPVIDLKQSIETLQFRN